MRRLSHIILSTSAMVYLGLAAEVPAPPAIVPGGVINSASRLPATLRGGAIARGARFTIPGLRLGPETGVRGSEADPPVRLADVSVRIQQGDTGVDAGLLLVSAAIIDAWLPASCPLGDVTLTVTYQGRTSDPYKLTIVRSNVGFYPSQPALSATSGETVTLRGTGLSEAALEVLVGGKLAGAVRISAEEACCRGVQQVTFQVPSDAPQGCFVPVQARSTDGRPSNVVPIGVHAPGQPCHDEADWFREGVERATRAGFLLLARVSLVTMFVPKSGAFRFDYGIGSFGRQESGQRPFPPLPPVNTCTVFASRVNLRQLVRQSRTPTEWTSIPEKTPGNRRLDLGPAISISGPGGTHRLDRDVRQHDYYSAILGGKIPYSHDPAIPLFLRSGRYAVSADGGADVGPFSLKLPVPVEVTWKNRNDIAAVDRDAGVTLEWTAARPGDAILIMATNADPKSGDAAVCLCLAPARQGHFTIPSISLGNLPPTFDNQELSGSYLLLMEIPRQPPARIEARGLDAAFAAFVSVSGRRVIYR